MSIRVALNHRTSYHYDRLVTLSPQVVRLRPAPHCRTPIHSYSLNIAPSPHFINWQQDPQGNWQARLVFPEKTRHFTIEVDLVAEMTVINPFAFFLEPEGEHFPFTYAPALLKELRPFLKKQAATIIFADYLRKIDRGRRRSVTFLVELIAQLAKDIRYTIRMEPGVQTCGETLTKRSGSCRDTAWLLVQLLRHLGLAARFVSGYLIQLTADQKSLDGPSGPENDFTDLHAWAEVYLPGAGWVGLDATSGLFAGEGHIPVACTPEPSSAAPVSGGVDECETEFGFAMKVTRVHETPRVTKPYTDEQWQAILATGHVVDRHLHEGDVRLSMGGEPTFVAVDDPDGAEWNTAALGANKRLLAGDLLHRLQRRFAPGALLHYGQGKWYPGEPLPRWALGCYWRRDGRPIWQNRELIADDRCDYGHGDGDADGFLAALATRLGIDPELSIPAYEDVWHYLMAERRLPVNVDPFKSQLKDPIDRARLARVFEQGLDKIVGFALPIEPRNGGWASGRWYFRQERLFLLPGDSPMGLRLPLDSLPWVAAEDRDPMLPIDPMIPRRPLPDPDAVQRQRRLPSAARSGTPPSKPHAEWQPRPHQSAPEIVRTTLCVEPRDGRLHVFMPPVKRLEDYLELVAAVEATAGELKTPVLVEGYPPPVDPRLEVLKVTPDPGVIEVNIHPARSWGELVENTVGVYDDARITRLAAEKFMLDGRHTGTGGGNHITVGAPLPGDSPFLRRPDLLRSMLGYFHNHPALSYLFSGMFVGPTSQAPRVDEARNDALYELEIAFDQLPEKGSYPPWLVDRLFRNLLIDVSGNTHRAEFSIDKLYSPDSSTGRLGLVEMRGFEMPPDPKMSLCQQLLLRSLIAGFWRQPYRQKLVRWGTELHDRFLLPHFVAEDFAEVCADLQRQGYAVDPAWFRPHHEFRFPLHGEVAPDGIKIEVRQAIEPWHVMGEEPGPGGTARYVDSSLERVEVLVRGMVDSRHQVACNGHALPLHPTGTSSEFVAGVRYRAWQPPSALHPTIGVHVPLVFDLVDTWNGRSLGGCTYHVAHPGGMSYENFPVNANAAQARRGLRFQPFGHTPGAMRLAPPERSLEHPFTLDLRR